MVDGVDRRLPATELSQDEVLRRVRSAVRQIAKLDRPVADDESLLGTVLDSLGVLQLISDLEDSFHLAFDEDEMTPAHFRTLGDVAKLVMTRLSPRG
jgi:acyl carrier protein